MGKLIAMFSLGVVFATLAFMAYDDYYYEHICLYRPEVSINELLANSNREALFITSEVK